MRPFAVTRYIRWNSSSITPKSRELPKVVSNFSTFNSDDLVSMRTQNPMSLPDETKPIPFGKVFSDHMVSVDWNLTSGWQKPTLSPLAPIQLHPASKVLHYAIEVFEGLKAYYGVDGQVRLFRPHLNMERMIRSAERSSLPTFDPNQAVDLVKQFVSEDINWVPRNSTGALYLRPTLIGTDPSLGVSPPNEAKWFLIGSYVQGYFSNSDKGLSLLADPKYVRSWRGGVGAFKMGCNYAPTLFVSKQAERDNCHQVMWLSGKEQNVTEAGAMNLFIFWKNEQGEDELLTAPTEDGLLLPGITRQSILELAREWGQFKVTERNFGIDEVREAVKKNKVYEMFASGTAAVVGPVSEIVYRDEQRSIKERLKIPTMQSSQKLFLKFYDTITGIQYGRIPREDWTVEVPNLSRK